jgi:hypothetical protein
VLEKYREVKQVDGVISASVVEQWNTSMDEHKLFEKTVGFTGQVCGGISPNGM